MLLGKPVSAFSNVALGMSVLEAPPRKLAIITFGTLPLGVLFCELLIAVCGVLSATCFTELSTVEFGILLLKVFLVTAVVVPLGILCLEALLHLASASVKML